MTPRLFESFCTYLGTFQKLKERIRENKRNWKGEHPNITASKQEHLMSLVKEAEGQKEFEELGGITKSEFSSNNEWGEWGDWGDCKEEVRNFFRNSGCYVDLFNDKKLNNEELFISYCKEFQKQDYQIKLLALMEFVEFAEDSMDFGSFRIRKFSTNELKAILRNEINEIFYPKAHFDVTELNKLEKYWFISLSAPRSVVRPSRKIRPSIKSNPIERKYTKYPKPLEDILKCLILFEWKLCQAWSPDFTLNIPLIMQINECLLVSPWWTPDLSVLETTGDCDPVTHESAEIPAVRFRLDASKTELFKKLITEVKKILDNLNIKENNWGFLEIAQNYLIKAFFSETEYLEQLLWHITTIDALLGENKPGRKKRLARRIAFILEKTEAEKENIKNLFNKVYQVRCDLVHGNLPNEEVRVSQIYGSRNLARKTLLWFLHCFGYINSKIQDIQPTMNIPTREDVLRLLDSDQSTMARLDWLIKSFPTDFPYIKEWVE